MLEERRARVDNSPLGKYLEEFNALRAQVFTSLSNVAGRSSIIGGFPEQSGCCGRRGVVGACGDGVAW